MEGDRYVEADPYFETQPLLPAAIVLEGLAVISHNAVNEQITKANKRLAAGDFAGAIASSYTLTEHLLKLTLPSPPRWPGYASFVGSCSTSSVGP